MGSTPPASPLISKPAAASKTRTAAHRSSRTTKLTQSQLRRDHASMKSGGSRSDLGPTDESPRASSSERWGRWVGPSPCFVNGWTERRRTAAADDAAEVAEFAHQLRASRALGVSLTVPPAEKRLIA